jgi:hypothetical protein
MAADLPIHPLIRGLSVALADPASPDRAGATAAAIAEKGAWPPAAIAPPQQKVLTDALRNFSDPRRPPVVMFAGYLGPSVWGPGNKRWRLLYQDAKAASWLLVFEEAIVLHDRVEDKKAAFRLRDVIWVTADAPVRQGTEEESQQARFLAGTFTNAGDLHATLRDANPPAPGSGILCAPTPECCNYYRTR